MIGMKKFLVYLVFLMFWITFPVLFVYAAEEGDDIPCTSASAESVQMFLKGREAYEMGRIKDAEAYFDKALMKDQRFAQAWLYKAFVSVTDEDRDINLGKALMNRSFASEGEKILIDLATPLPENKSFQRLKAAQKLVGLYPSGVRALLVLANEYQLLEEFAKFRELAHLAIQMEPDSPLGYRSLASSFLFNPPVDFALAVKYMEKYVALRPHEPSAHIAMGDVYRANLSLMQARDAYDKAARLDPACTIALAKRGYMHSYLGMFDKARDDFSKARDMVVENEYPEHPDNNPASYLFPVTGLLPDAASWSGITSTAGTHGGKYKMEGVTPDHHFCCTVVSMSGGLFVTPFQSQKECLCLQREFVMESRVPGMRVMDANFAFMAAMRAIQQGDFENAGNHILAYTELSNPGENASRNEAGNFLLGLMHMHQGHYAKAISSYLKSDVNNICVKYNLGVAYHFMGNLEEAEKMFAEVIKTTSPANSNSEMVKTANRWMKSMAVATEQQK